MLSHPTRIGSVSDDHENKPSFFADFLWFINCKNYLFIISAGVKNFGSMKISSIKKLNNAAVRTKFCVNRKLIKRYKSNCCLFKFKSISWSRDMNPASTKRFAKRAGGSGHGSAGLICCHSPSVKRMAAKDWSEPQTVKTEQQRQVRQQGVSRDNRTVSTCTQTMRVLVPVLWIQLH